MMPPKLFSRSKLDESTVKFEPTRMISSYLAMDDTNKILKIMDHMNKEEPIKYIPYHQVLGCEIVIDGTSEDNATLFNTIDSSTTITGTRKNSRYIESIAVRIKLDSSTEPFAFVNTLVFKKCKTNSLIAKNSLDDARAIHDAISYLNFTLTRKISTYLEIDDDHQVIKIKNKKVPPKYIPYDKILDCEIYIDDMPGANTGLLGAAAGGLLFGGTGAVVGSIAGKKNEAYVQSVSIRIRTNSLMEPSVSVETLNLKCKSDSTLARNAIENARAIQDAILCILNSRSITKDSLPQQTVNQGYIEELRKLKELVDEGILTQEEFEAKKKQLLS